MPDSTPMLQVDNLKQYFPLKRGLVVKAVDGVSLTVKKGETFGLVGESGCGKSTLARSVIRIYKPTEGHISLDGQEIGTLREKELRSYRRQMQMIFQDPYSSLNARMTVRDILLEPLIANGVGENLNDRTDMALHALSRVGLSSDYIGRYPHEFSGGQRQRIGIARALILQPKLVICDEAISALDVSIQAQVVNMLGEFQQELGLTYLFIAHDLSMVRYVSHRVGVMYLGRLVEVCDSEEIYKNPLHPYTQALLSAIPVPDPAIARHKKKTALEGEVPSPIHPPTGCHFHTRCPHATEECAVNAPKMRDVGGGHQVCCHLFDKDGVSATP